MAYDWKSKVQPGTTGASERRDFLKMDTLLNGSVIVFEEDPQPVKASKFGIFEARVQVRRTPQEAPRGYLFAPSERLARLLIGFDLKAGVGLMVQRDGDRLSFLAFMG